MNKKDDLWEGAPDSRVGLDLLYTLGPGLGASPPMDSPAGTGGSTDCLRPQ